MNIAIIGYGVEGKSLVQYFRRHGYTVTICDIATHGDIKSSEGVHIKLGPHYLNELKQYDQVFRSPGIPYLKKEFLPVKSKLTSLIKYFFEKCPCPIVGVTGTKGKGTVSTLIYEMLKYARGKTGKGQVYLGGNIGESPMTFLDKLKADDIVVLELSSFQLQDLTRSPHVAVVLGITPDHLDHHADMAEYVEAKKNIVKFQKDGDIAILDRDNKYAEAFSADTKAGKLYFSTEGPVDEGGFVKVGKLIVKQGKTGTIIGEVGATKMIGEHNLKNILAASVAAHALGVPVEIITQVAREFPGLPHRLEFVAETKGVRYYNDSASTNPHTAVAALRAFKGPVILIAGGSDKNTNFAPLGQEIAKMQNVKAVVVMGQTKPKIEHAIEEAIMKHKTKREVSLELINAESYQEAFMVARVMAQPGDTVLLSPACASFDMFSNYKERGDIFRNFVMEG